MQKEDKAHKGHHSSLRFLVFLASPKAKALVTTYPLWHTKLVKEKDHFFSWLFEKWAIIALDFFISERYPFGAS